MSVAGKNNNPRNMLCCFVFLLAACAASALAAPHLPLSVSSSLLLSTSTFGAAVSSPVHIDNKMNGFVTSKGSQLFLPDGSLFRWGGGNAYWLGLDQNIDGSVEYPTDFRIKDALITAAGLGLSVIRSHTVGISTGNPRSFEPSLHVFNDSALRAADLVIATAEQLGLRLIVPLTDNYNYYLGGKHDFTDWTGVTEEEFYTQEKPIAAFKEYTFLGGCSMSTLSPIAGRWTSLPSWRGRRATSLRHQQQPGRATLPILSNRWTRTTW